MTKINGNEIAKIVSLARLHLNQIEMEQAANDLEKVLDYMSLLNELDTQNIEPMTAVIEETHRFRKDDIIPSIDRELVLTNAPKHDEECFLVPKVLEYCAWREETALTSIAACYDDGQCPYVGGRRHFFRRQMC